MVLDIFIRLKHHLFLVETLMELVNTQGENQNSGDNKAKQRTLINNTSVRISVLHLSFKILIHICFALEEKNPVIVNLVKNTKGF